MTTLTQAQTRARTVLADRIADAETRWSFGTFGAIAEFVRDPDEPFVLSDAEASLSVTTARGGILVDPIAAARLFASESAVGETWSHRVALCLPADQCTMSRRPVLTELGRDAGALRECDRDGVLFDLGLDCLQVDVCVRSSDRDLIAQLRENAGRPVFEPGNPVVAAILTANPHRVFVSRIGRAEVYQPIPLANGRSPVGPHTHVLPKLLAHRRTHAAIEPIPDGWVPCAHFYPPHPVKDGMARARPFDAEHHAAFQDLLQAFGDPRLAALKQRVFAAVMAGQEPSALPAILNRYERASVRVALRQLRISGQNPPAIESWIAVHDGPAQSLSDDDTQVEDLR